MLRRSSPARRTSAIVPATVFRKRGRGFPLGPPRSLDVMDEVESHAVCRQRCVNALGGLCDPVDKPISFFAIHTDQRAPTLGNGLILAAGPAFRENFA
jgi:hypothetical protein